MADATLPTSYRAPGLPLAVRRFRPVPYNGPPITHRVEVVALIRIGADSVLSCRGLDDPSWFYEVTTPRAVEVGTFGIVSWRNIPTKVKQIAERWNYTPDEVEPCPPTPLIPPDLTSLPAPTGESM